MDTVQWFMALLLFSAYQLHYRKDWVPRTRSNYITINAIFIFEATRAAPAPATNLSMSKLHIILEKPQALRAKPRVTHGWGGWTCFRAVGARRDGSMGTDEIECGGRGAV
jgi:cytochrome b561